MAHTKSQGAANRHIRRPGKRLGVKIYGGEVVRSGNIIIRQKGSKFHSGTGTSMGNDFTIFAVTEGVVYFKRMSGGHRGQNEIQVLPAEKVFKITAKGVKTTVAKTEVKAAKSEKVSK